MGNQVCPLTELFTERYDLRLQSGRATCCQRSACSLHLRLGTVGSEDRMRCQCL